MKYDAIIVASGKGKRANLGYNKAFFKLDDNRTILDISSTLFIEDRDCQNIIVVTNKDDFNKVKSNDKLILVEGGKERKDSVLNGLKMVKSEFVLIHDAARPFLTKENLEAIKNKVAETGSAILAHKAIDTIKVVENNKIIKTLDRNTIYMAETPQGFKTELILDCYRKCKDINFTDEASLLESLNKDVYIVENKTNNKKLTTEEDFKDL